MYFKRCRYTPSKKKKKEEEERRENGKTNGPLTFRLLSNQGRFE